MELEQFIIETGPFVFSVKTNILSLKQYIQTHYCTSLRPFSTQTFIDYYVEVKHGPWYRRAFSPQAHFLFNSKTPFKPLPLNQAHAMLEWGMNWVISSNAHQYLALHAASLEKGGKAIIIAAPPGSGKSTLCAYLASQGWNLLTDEITLVDLEECQLTGPQRPINLKNNSIGLMRNYFSDDAFSATAEDTHKGTVCLVNTRQDKASHNNPVQGHLILFVRYTPEEECYLEEVSKPKALVELIRNAFNLGLLNIKGFEAAKRLIRQSRTVYLEYNDLPSAKSAINAAFKETEIRND